MKIQFLLPIAGIAGGVKVVYEYANRLQERGHEVTILYPRKMFPQVSPLWRAEAVVRQAKFKIDALRGKTEADWFPLQVPLIRTPSLEARYIPSADITIATSNETAEWVAKLPQRCGDKYYFIQDYEIWLRDKELVDATWKLPLKKIVISEALRELGEQKFKEKVYAVIPNGVDTEVFYPNKKKIYHTPRHILMMYHVDERKGISDGFAALELIRRDYPDLKVTLFGAFPPGEDVPSYTEYHQAPALALLRELYADADIFLSPSWKEGFHLPPMEAMACKAALVATNVGGVPTYTQPGKTALVVEPHQPEAFAQAIRRLVENDDLLQKVSEAGFAYIQNFTWEKACDRLEAVFRENTSLE